MAIEQMSMDSGGDAGGKGRSGGKRFGCGGGGKPLSKRAKLYIVYFVATVIVTVSVALGIKFGSRRGGPADGDGDGNGGDGSHKIWQPTVNTTWQIVLSQELHIDKEKPWISPDVDAFDIDMFLHQNTSVVDDLHALGKRVICYFSAGSYEPYRPDAYRFREEDMGKTLDGWPDERWLNLSSPNVREIMRDRLVIAGSMNCDAVDPDNMDGYLNDNGLGLTVNDTVDFFKFLAEKTTKGHKIAIGLKNAPDIINRVIDDVAFAVNEQCAEQDNCRSFEKFIQAGKPVFHIEYPRGAGPGYKFAAGEMNKSCSAKGMSGFSTVLKDLSLDNWVGFCDGSDATTAVVESD